MADRFGEFVLGTGTLVVTAHMCRGAMHEPCGLWSGFAVWD